MIENALRLLPWVVGSGFLWKLLDIYKEFVGRRVSKRQESLEQLKWMQALLESKGDSPRKFVTEQAFLERFGVVVDFHVVEYVLSCRNPSAALSEYLAGWQYIKLEASGEHPRFSDPRVLFIKKSYCVLAAYYGFAIFGISIVFMFDSLLAVLNGRIWLVLFFAISSVVFSYVSLTDYLRLQAAERFLLER